MAEEKPKAASAKAEGAPAPKSRARLFILVGAAVAVLVAGGAGFVLLRGSGDAGHEEEASGEEHGADGHGGAGAASAAPAAVVGTMLELEPFIVNIHDQDRDRYLKLEAQLELSAAPVGEEITARMPQVRDLVISLLGSKSFEEIRTIEGKNLLRDEIQLRINAVLTTGQVQRIYFTEFVVQ